MADGFRIASAYVAVEPSDEGFRAQLEAKIKEAVQGTAATVKVDADAEGLAEKVRAEAAAADAETHVKVKLDDAGDFEAQFRRAMAEGETAVENAAAEMRRSFTTLEQASRTVRASMDDAGQGAQNAGRKVEDAGNKASNAGNKAGAAGSGFRLGAVGMGAMVTAGASLIPTLAAIPGLAAGAAAGVGVMAGAFLGVAKALHDYGAQQDAVGGGGGGGNSAATAYSNAVAIRSAEQAIADAREQSARSAQQSTEEVQSAQQGVVDAERQAATAAQNSADQITAAQQRVTQATYAGQQAQQAYTNALYNQQQAEKALTDAKAAAADQLVDSQNAAKDAHLATEDAAIQADAAEKQLQLTKAAGGTPDQIAAADLAARKAAQALVDAKQREKEAVEKSTAATKAAVDQAPAVLAAQHAVELATQATAAADHGRTQAAQQQTDAAAALAKAVQAAADQQISSDEQVAKARQQLADAQRQADQQREDSAKAVQRAEQNLTDTIKEQQLAAESAGGAGAAAANKFQQDYAKLTPAAKAFVDQVLSMRGELHKLGDEAQTATLPGFTQWLKESQRLFPTVEDGVKRTGTALSDMAMGFAAVFANPQFDASAQQFEQIVTGGFGEFTSALPPLLNAIVTDGVRAGPLINSVAVGVHDLISSGLPEFLDGLTSQSGNAALGVGALFHAVDDLLGPVGRIAGAVAGALGPALDDLEQNGFKPLVDDIESALLPLMPELQTDLQDVAQLFGGVVQVLEPAIPMIADGLSSGLQIVGPLLKDTADFLRDNEQWLQPVAKDIVIMVAAWKAYQLVASPVAKLIDGTTSALGRFSGATKTAGKEAETAGEAIGGARGVATKIGNSLPIVGAAVTGFMAFGNWLNHVMYDGHGAATSIDEYTVALLNSADPTKNAVTGLSQYAQLSQAIGSNKSQVTDTLAQTGLGMIELSKATFGTSGDLANYDASLAKMVTDGNADRARDIVAQLSQATDIHGQKIVDVTRDLPAYAAQLKSTAADQESATRAAANTGTAVDNLGRSLLNTRDKWQVMSDTMSNTESLDRFHTGLLNLKDAADQNGTSLDGNTKSGLANRQAFADLADQIRDYGKKLTDSGGSNDAAAAKMRDMIGQLEDQGKKLGYSKDAIDAYIKQLGLVPDLIETKINTEFAIKFDDQGLQAAATHFFAPKKAAGGPVVGPGTATSDEILTRLSNGEYVVPADATAKLGPAAMEQIRHGQIPSVGGTTPQPTAPTINFNYYGTQQPTPEQMAVMKRDFALAVRS